MILPDFDFYAPSSLDELFQLMQELGPAASVMAGGTDLLMALKSGRRSSEHVVSLKGIAELDGLGYDDSAGLTIGANTALADVATYGPALEQYSSLVDSIETLATPQIRQKATVAGNLCNASPCADTAMSLMALSARALIIGPGGSSREVPVEDLLIGPRQTSLREFEIVHSVIVPPPREHQRSMFMKHSRRSKVDIAATSICIALVQKNAVIDHVDIFMGSVAPRPLRARKAETVLTGQSPAPELFRRAAEAAQSECKPISDLRASADHKLHMIGVMARRILEQLTVQS